MAHRPLSPKQDSPSLSLSPHLHHPPVFHKWMRLVLGDRFFRIRGVKVDLFFFAGGIDVSFQVVNGRKKRTEPVKESHVTNYILYSHSLQDPPYNKKCKEGVALYKAPMQLRPVHARTLPPHTNKHTHAHQHAL